MTAKHQEQPASSKTHEPRVYHWIPKNGETTLCGKAMPPRRKQLYDSAATHERIVCPQCETFRLFEAQLDW